MLPTEVEPITPPDGFEAAAEALGVSFEPGELDRLGRYLALLMAANKAMNLTAIRDPGEAWTRHILDSLSLLAVLTDLQPGAELIDVGSGGGLPGIPLAIVSPGLRFTLLDATAKKTRFLTHAVGMLGLSNVEVITGRAETLGRDRGERTATGRTGGHRDRYDAVLCRAVGKIALVAELAVPLAKVGGLIVLTKGQRADEELADAKAALHMLHAAHAGTIDTPTGRLVVLEKQRTTPKLYPRRDGEPKKHPLGMS